MKLRPNVQPIYARAETITEKRLFNDAYAKRRCIVPMQVFYERDHSRRLHAFGMKNGKPSASRASGRTGSTLGPLGANLLHHHGRGKRFGLGNA